MALRYTMSICAITLVLYLLPASSFLSGNTISYCLLLQSLHCHCKHLMHEILHLQAQKEMQVCVTGRSEQRTEFNLIA